MTDSALFSNHNQEGTCHTIQHRKHPPGERISDAFNRNQVAQRDMEPESRRILTRLSQRGVHRHKYQYDHCHRTDKPNK